MPAELTDRQRRFVDEYLVDLNAAGAARRAGYSPKTADRIGSKLLRNPRIATEVERAQAERRERTKITQDAVLDRLAEIAFAQIGDYVVFAGKTVMLQRSPALASTAAISSVAGDGESVRIRLHDPLRALELLGKHLGTFKERIEIDHTSEGLNRLLGQLRLAIHSERLANALEAGDLDAARRAMNKAQT
jgi:phage terminase small subunit